VPWLAPSFTRRDWVGHGAGPGGVDEAVGEPAGVVGAAGVVAGAPLAEDSDAASLFPPLPEVPVQPVASTAAQVSATAGNTRRARS